MFLHSELCILMDFPIHIETMSMELPIVYFKDHCFYVEKYDVFLSYLPSMT